MDREGWIEGSGSPAPFPDPLPEKITPTAFTQSSREAEQQRTARGFSAALHLCVLEIVLKIVPVALFS
jgi:hypothetical protein